MKTSRHAPTETCAGTLLSEDAQVIREPVAHAGKGRRRTALVDRVHYDDRGTKGPIFYRPFLIISLPAILTG